MQVEVDPVVKPTWTPIIPPMSGGPQAVMVPMGKDDPDYLREIAPIIPTTDQFKGNTTPFRFQVIQVLSRPRVHIVLTIRLRRYDSPEEKL